VHGTQLHIFGKPNQIVLQTKSQLQGQQRPLPSTCLVIDISIKILSDFSNQALKGILFNQEFSRFLVFANLSKDQVRLRVCASVCARARAYVRALRACALLLGGGRSRIHPQFVILRRFSFRCRDQRGLGEPED